MFNQILRFELSYLATQASFYVSSLIIFILAFCFAAVEDMTFGHKNIFINAGYNITSIHMMLGLVCSFAVVNFVASSALRNNESKMVELIGAKPMPTLQYNLAKFLGAYLVVSLVFLAVPLGYMIGTFMPWVEPERLSAFELGHYVRAFLILTLPSMFFLSCLFYAIAQRTRSSMAVYLSAVVVLVLYSISGTFLRELDTQMVAALLDPFGGRAVSEITRYWSIEQKNTNALSFTENLLLNRVLWVSLGVMILSVFGRLSTRIVASNPKKIKKSAAKKAQAEAGYKSALIDNFAHTKATQTSQWKILFNRISFETKLVLTTPSFFVLLTVSVLFLCVVLSQQTGFYGTTTLPITKNMVTAISASFALLSLIIVTFYSAEVVWREKSHKIADIVGRTPVSNIVFWLAKFVAVNAVLLVIYFVAVLSAMVYQLFNGVTDFELSQYFISVGFFTLLPLSMSVVLSMLIQTVVNNKYLGMFIFILVSMLPAVLVSLGFEHHLYQFAVAPTMQYSDMNGYAWYLETQSWFMLYWGAFSTLLAVAAFGLWSRGADMNFADKAHQLKLQLKTSGVMQVTASIALLVFVGSGSVIYYNTQVINKFMTSEQTQDLLESYERQYAHLLDAPVPTMTKVLAKVDLFPSERRLDASFDVTFENKSQQSISEFIVNEPGFAKEWDVKISGGRLTHQEPIEGVAKFVFDQAMLPGEQRRGVITVSRAHQGFRSAGFDNTLVKNGTFISNFQLLPYFGVSKRFFLSDPAERRERNLAEMELANKLEDTDHHNESYMGKGMDFIEFAAQLSTEEGQTAIAPGYLVNQWEADGRHHFHYQMDSKIKNFYSILSAKLAVKKQQHKGVNIEVYHHAKHDKNINLMIDAVKASLDYFTAEFGDYQHKQMRIIEFPGYRSFAQSFANTVPYAETMGFISNTSDDDKVNVPFLVTAHEVAHQWWGHQLGGANVEGSALLSETLSEYSALKVIEHSYGKAVMANYLKRELNYYLSERSRETREEKPLIRTASQNYLHYYKGGLVMMALADRIGEEKVNRALAKLLNTFKYQTNPYPTSLDLVNALEQEATTEQLGFIRQQFNEINLYHLRVVAAQSKQLADGQYQTELSIEAKRRVADGKGLETQMDFADDVQIVLVANDDAMDLTEQNLLHQQTYRLITGENKLVITTNTKPQMVHLDPHSHFVDTVKKDNIKTIKTL